MASVVVSPLPSSITGWKRPPTIPGPEPLPYFSRIGKGGKDTLWVGFVLFLVSTLIIAVLAARQHKKHRAFHFITMLITGIAALSYYAMAVGSGYTYINVGMREIQGQRTTIMRQVFWAREVDWAFTTPLILLDLALLAGLPWLEVMALLIVDEAMVLTGLFSALHPGHPSARWGWYTFNCLFLLGVIYMLLWNGRKSAQKQHDSVSTLYIQLSVYTVVLWILYPIIFAVGEGAGHISTDSETIAYTIIDIFAKIVFGLWLLVRHKHDGDEECAVVLPESWTEPRGTKTGVIQLPGGEEM